MASSLASPRMISLSPPLTAPASPHAPPLAVLFLSGHHHRRRSLIRQPHGGLQTVISSNRLQSRRCSEEDDFVLGSDNGSSFCIIEGPESAPDFVQMQLKEIQDNIVNRRNKIFLLMEEVRRLRIQQRIKRVETVGEICEENEMLDMPSTIPFVPHMTSKTLKQLYSTSFSFVIGIIAFGGLFAPVLELKLGIGGTSYEDFIRHMHLPLQLSEVDPIVASFSGGAVGVISALMLIEANNVEKQEKKRCKYCHGTGYLACARCSASGEFLSVDLVSIIGECSEPLQIPKSRRCSNCSGTGKVMCPTCLCTGVAMASEHDPRIDPFD